MNHAELPVGARGPGIHLVLGPPNAGKLGRVIRWWGDQSEREPLIVVPTRPDVPLVTRELVERVGAVVGTRPVLTFDGLAGDVRGCSPGPGPPPRVLGDLERRIALGRALTIGTAPSLEPLLETAGGMDALSDLVREVLGSGVPLDHAVTGLRGWRSGGGAELGRDLAAFLEAYRDLLEGAGRAEREDVVRGAVAAAHHWHRPVACYGFVSFTPLQRMLLRRLAAAVPVVVSLTDDPGRRWSAYFAAEVAHWAGEAVSIERLDRERHAYSSPQIARLEGSFLEPAPVGSGREVCPDALVGPMPASPDLPETPDRGSGVRFLLASGRTAEAELVARQVVALLRDGVAADQIGVLVRDVRPWRKVLGRTLGAYGVPFHIDAEVDFAETGLGAALLSLARGLSEASLEPLLAYCRSPYCPADPAAVDRLESEVRGARTVADKALMRAVRRALPAGSVPLEGLVQRDPSGRRLVDPAALRLQAEAMVITAARGRGPQSPEAEEDVAALNSLVDALEQISSAAAAGWLSEGASSVDQRTVRTDRLDESVAPLPHLPTVIEYVRSARVLTGGGDGRPAVWVMSVHRARARRFQAVFLLGLADGEFPRAERVPVLLTARQRKAVDEALGASLFSESPAGEDVGLFALAVSRPWQLLCLSGRDAEDGGEPVSLSPYWEEAMRCLEVERPEACDRRSLSEVVHPLDLAPSAREFLRACAAGGVSLPGPTGARIAESSRCWDCRPARLGGRSLDRLAARQEFRVTEIEQYARCPFAWFIDGLVGLEDMEEELDDRTMGSVLHRSLRHLYMSLGAEGLLPLRAVGIDRAEALASAAVDRSVRELRPPGTPGEVRLLRRRVGSRVRAALEADITADARLAPSDFERPLPSGGVDIGGVRLTGRIDRIDGGRSGEPMFVIDYKSGTGGSAPPFDSPGAVQVRLYLLALRTLDPHGGLAGGAYLYLGGPAVKGVVVADHADDVGARIPSGRACSAEELDDLLETAREAALRAAGAIRSGLIPAEPADRCPSYCGLRPLCRTRSRPRRW